MRDADVRAALRASPGATGEATGGRSDKGVGSRKPPRRVNSEAALTTKYRSLFDHLDERQRRLVAAADATQLGRGGVSTVARCAGLSRPTIHKGLQELGRTPLPGGRVRRPGAGRRPLREVNPALRVALERLIDPATRGDPMSPLRWTSKSTRHLAGVLTKAGHAVSHETLANMLHELGYSL